MNTVVLNGSPHAAGNGMRLAAWLLADLGGDAETFHLYDRAVLPCRGCTVCGGVASCIIDDAMPSMVAKTLEADCVVMVSPVHFSSLSAPLVAFISRLQMIWDKGRCAEKGARRGCGALLVSGGSEYPGMFDPSRKVAGAAFKTLGLPFAGMVAVPGTDETDLEGNAVVRAEIADLAKRIQTSLAF